jgi:alpha-amylase
MSESLFIAAPFLSNTNMYEVNVRQYTPEGTFNAFAAHLPRLKDMGVAVLWMMPIHPIGAVKRKGTLGSYYSIADFKALNPEYGTASDFKNLIEKVHALGMKIIIDWVANHAAWDNVWTKTNPNFFERDAEGNFKAPYDWDDVIQIDHKSEAEQYAMIDAMQYWVTDFDIDGFRADLAHLTPLQFWKNARTRLTNIKKDLIWLAETEEINYHEAFDISFTWKWMHATEKFATGEKTFADCIKVLAEYDYDFPKTALRLFFTSNHDENSWNGTEYEKYGILAKAFAVFALTFSDIPLIYSGQELPNTKRLQFFEKDTIEWGEAFELHDFYKTLFAFRKRSNAFNKNAQVFFYEELISKNIMAYKLTKDNDEVLVLINLNKENILEHLVLPQLHATYKNVFSGEEIKIAEKYLIGLDAGGFCVLEKLK